MSNAQKRELEAQIKMVTILVNDEEMELSEWTLTTLEARAYREGKSLDEIFHDLICSLMDTPEVLDRLRVQGEVEELMN